MEEKKSRLNFDRVKVDKDQDFYGMMFSGQVGLQLNYLDTIKDDTCKTNSAFQEKTRPSCEAQWWTSPDLGMFSCNRSWPAHWHWKHSDNHLSKGALRNNKAEAELDLHFDWCFFHGFLKHECFPQLQIKTRGKMCDVWTFLI